MFLVLSKYIFWLMYSPSEENYIKTIYSLNPGTIAVSTTAIAERLQTKASSVTDMMQKLADKRLVNYQKYRGVQLTEHGRLQALKTIRKHRLWEVFLVKKLGFSWDEVHALAEELEHIQSPKLTEKLAAYLGDPKFDPHGDPIPDANGILPDTPLKPLSECQPKTTVTLQRVADGDPAFLQYVSRLALKLGESFSIEDVFSFDGSVEIKRSNGETLSFSKTVSNHLFVLEI